MALNDELHSFLVCLLVQLIFGCVCKAHLVDFSIEGLLLGLLVLEIGLEVPLLLVHLLLVSESVFVEHFVLLLLRVEAIAEPTIVHYFFSHFVLGVVGSDKLVGNFDFVLTTLLNELLVLAVANHTLFAFLETFPLLVFDHGGVSVHVLPLELDLLELFGQASVFISLILFLC